MEHQRIIRNTLENTARKEMTGNADSHVRRKRIAEIWLTKAENDDPALILAHIGEPTKSRPVPGNDQPHNSPFPANTTTGK